MQVFEYVSLFDCPILACFWLTDLGMSQARPIRPGTTYLITRRIERRYCLLRPDRTINAFILYAFIVSARRHGILLHAFCAMSTHMHYVVSDPDGKLPKFLRMFHRLVALGVKAIRHWDGAVWNRSQTSVVELCTRQAIAEKIAYALANPVRAGLVRFAREWPGFKTSVNDIGAEKLHGQRPKECFNAKNDNWKLQVEYDVSLPPSIPTADARDFREEIQRELARLEAAAHAAIPISKVLGVKRVYKLNPQSRITSYEPARQLNPTIAAGKGNAEALQAAKQARREFQRAYRLARESWRSGNHDVEFPAGTYAMRVFHAANVAS